MTIKGAIERLIGTYEKRPDAAKGTGRTSVHLSSGMRCEIKQGDWTFVADQPVATGGQGLGPDPGFFGRAALGACAAQGYAMWFARQDLTFRSINVEIEGDSDARGFLGVSRHVPPGYLNVRCIVTIESDAGEDDIIAALDEADRHSPWLYDFTTALDVTRQVTIKPE